MAVPRLADQPQPDQSVTQVPAAQERSPPDRGWFAVPAAYLAAMAAADLQRPGQPRPQLVVCRLEAEHENRTRAVTASGHQRLVVAEQAAVGRIEPRLRKLPGRLHSIAEVGKKHRGARPELRPRLHPHPRLGDHAQRAFGAAEQPLGRLASTGGRQPPGSEHAARRHHADRLHELVDMSVKRREMAARACRYPPAQRRPLKRLREMPQRQAVRLQLRLQRRAQRPRRDPRGPRTSRRPPAPLAGGEGRR